MNNKTPTPTFTRFLKCHCEKCIENWCLERIMRESSSKISHLYGREENRKIEANLTEHYRKIKDQLNELVRTTGSAGKLALEDRPFLTFHSESFKNDQ